MTRFAPRFFALPLMLGLMGFLAEDEALFLGFSGSAYTVGATITPTSTVPEAEEHIAVDPNNFNHLIAMISDFSQNGGFNTSKYAFSSNNGGSWAEKFVPLLGGFPATADNHIWQANSDPVVAIDKKGNVFLANLYLQADSMGNVTNDGYYVCSATLASGPAFKQTGCHPVRTTLIPSTNVEDKPWLAVDNSSSTTAGNVYGFLDALHRQLRHDFLLALHKSRRLLVHSDPNQPHLTEWRGPRLAGGGGSCRGGVCRLRSFLHGGFRSAHL